MVAASGTNSFAKEMAIRRRMGNIFNKREDDFESLKEYNDYLEEVEDMTCNLIEGIDVANIEAMISKYEQENADQIMNARARKAEELAAALAASKRSLGQTETQEPSQSSQLGPSSASQGQYAPAVVGGGFMQPRPTGMTPQPAPLGGGIELDDEEMMRLRAEKGARAGGWTPELSRKRALEEALGSLWI